MCSNAGPIDGLVGLALRTVGFLYIVTVGFLLDSIMPRRNSLRRKIEARIDRSPDTVFLPREFAKFGGEDQVLRALGELTRAGGLLRLGYRVYGRAVTSRLSGQPILFSANGLLGAAREALTKLGVP